MGVRSVGSSLKQAWVGHKLLKARSFLVFCDMVHQLVCLLGKTLVYNAVELGLFPLLWEVHSRHDTETLTAYTHHSEQCQCHV